MQKRKDKGIVILLSIGITGMIAWVFYHSLWGMILLPVIWGVVNHRWSQRRKRQQEAELREHFMHGLQVLNTALQAGYSMENSWREVEKETQMLYGKTGMFYQEIERMNRSANMNIPVEELFAEAAMRSQCQEMLSFAQILEYGRKSGGNWTKVIEDSIMRLQERYETQKEIEVLISGKRLEQQVMNVIPIGILIFLQLSAWDYLRVLYESVLGILIMSVCLVTYGVAIWISEKIMDIQV